MPLCDCCHVISWFIVHCALTALYKLRAFLICLLQFIATICLLFVRRLGTQSFTGFQLLLHLLEWVGPFLLHLCVNCQTIDRFG